MTIFLELFYAYIPVFWSVKLVLLSLGVAFCFGLVAGRVAHRSTFLLRCRVVGRCFDMLL